jgi:predicted nuclease of predicted toxin-antitoxin system
LRFLIDEMFPPATAERLRDHHGHDALHVTEAGLGASDDAEVAAAARAQSRAVVTENVVHFAGQRDLVLVFVRKRNLPTGGAQASALATLLDRWAAGHPAPYQGPHWPR